MKRTTLACASLLLSGLSALSSAQSPFDPTETLAIPQGAFAAEPVTRCLSGFLTGNLRRDVLALHGTTPVLYHSAGTYRASIPYTDHSANDIALLDTTPSAAAGFAFVGPAGLARVTYDQGVFTTLTHPAPGFVDAARLVVVDLDGNGVQGIAALNADHSTLLLAPNAFSAGASNVMSVSLPAPVLALGAGDLLGSPAGEVVLVYATEIRVLDGSGLFIDNHATPLLTSATIVNFRQSGHSKDRMTLIAQPASGAGTFLLTLDGRMEAPVDAGLNEIASATAGRADVGEDQDLVVLSRTHDDAVVLYNQANGGPPSEEPTFVQDEKEFVGFLGSLGNEGAPEPICADFDADGDDDLMLLDASQQSFVILPNLRVSPESQRIRLAGERSGHFMLTESSRTAELEIAYDLPVVHLAGATEVEFTVWLQRDGAHVMDSTALALVYQSLEDHEASPQVLIPIANASTNLDDSYIVEARMVQRSSGTVTAAGPVWTGTFRPSSRYFDLLAENPPEIEQIAVFVIPLGEGAPSYQGAGPESDPEFVRFRREDSGMIPLPRAPEHDEDPPLGEK